MPYAPYSEEEITKALEVFPLEYYIQGEQAYSRAHFEIAKLKAKHRRGEMTDEDLHLGSEAIMRQVSRASLERTKYYCRLARLKMEEEIKL